MPNRLQAKRTAVIMVHPWGIDDGQGWNTPEPAGAADFATPEKNHLAARHTREVIAPFLNRLRGQTALVMYSLAGDEDPIRRKLYRSFTHTPTEDEREEGKRELQEKLTSFWLPDQRRFATSDCERHTLFVFHETTTWTTIVSDFRAHFLATNTGGDPDPKFAVRYEESTCFGR